MSRDRWKSKPRAPFAVIEEEFAFQLLLFFRRCVRGEVNSIVIYDRRKTFDIEACLYGVERGWLKEKLLEIDDQSTELRYYPTKAGLSSSQIWI